MATFIIEREWTTVTKWSIEAETLEAAQERVDDEDVDPGEGGVKDVDYWESAEQVTVREPNPGELD